MRYFGLLMATCLLLSGCNSCSEYDSNGNLIIVNEDGSLAYQESGASYNGEAGNVAYLFETPQAQPIYPNGMSAAPVYTGSYYGEKGVTYPAGQPVMMLTPIGDGVEDGDKIRVAGFTIKKGQYVTDFFDDYDVPMHAEYVGNNTLRWTYYVNREGKIVRWCDLKEYGPRSLCALVVDFHYKKVARAYSNCR